MRKILFISLCLFINLHASAQQSVIHTDGGQILREGIDLFQKEKYGPAQEFFQKFLSGNHHRHAETRKTATFYHAICAVELFHRDAEFLLTSFIYEYPESPLIRQAWFRLGNFFFRDKKYKDARKWLEMTEPEFLEPEQLDEYHFKLAYCYFKAEDYDRALASFAQVKDSDSPYASTATYYYGHIQYSNKNFESALEHFRKLDQDELFGRVVPFYISQIYYLQKKYDQVIDYAGPVLDTTKSRRGPEIARLIGESYYNTNRYKEALPYLEQYREKAPAANRTREDDYQLGFTYFKLSKYPEAILAFQGAVGDQDAIGQSAWYHLGWCQLQSGNKKFARSAWQEAAKSSFDTLLKEQALFDYAKLAYELGYDPYDEAVQALQDYMNAYPNSPRMDEAYSFLANIYTTTRNYRTALQSIERVKKKTEAIKSAYQRVAFFRGIELLNDKNYAEAIQHFDLSLQNPLDKNTAGLAHYWKAEALYRSGNFSGAVKEYQDFIYSLNAFNQKKFNRVNYSLGYAYLKQKDYKNAIIWFRKYTIASAGDETKVIHDAWVRLGDCYYAQRNLTLAQENYEKAFEITGPESDYALFQNATILGLNGKDERKISTLGKITTEYPNSPYADDARFESGRSYQNLGRNEEAFATYNGILLNHPRSKIIPDVMLQMALIKYDQNQDDEAVALYKKIEETYPGTEAAREAKNGMKRIYVEQGDQEALKPYLSGKSRQAQDSLLWEAAENAYLKGSCDKAAGQLEGYLKEFPEGMFSLQALAYKAKCELSTRKTDQAAATYRIIISRPRNKYTAEGLQMLGIFEKQQENYQAAMEHFKALESMAENNDQIMLVLSNIMRIQAKLGNQQEAFEYAQKILTKDKAGDDLRNEARLIIGRKWLNEANYTKAGEEFLKLKKLNSETGAEARYSLAYIHFQKGEFVKCEKAIFELIDEMPSYDLWLTRGFILLADNYIKQGNAFQAKRTLQSVIDHHEEDALKEQARKKLEAIIQQENQSQPPTDPGQNTDENFDDKPQGE
jgi:TolA-binding protein